jgi:geranylgeranyl diphosphate synthase type II
MGLAFQIRDDILDLTGSQEVIGKPIRSDVKNSKTTWAVLYGIEAAAERADELTRTALAVLDEAGARDDFLWELIRRLASRQF